MTTQTEALKLAISRLEWFIDAYPHDIAVSKDEFLQPFKEALAQPEQEPVAWTEQRFYDDGTPNPCSALKWAGRNAEDDFPVGTKFYTTPPQRKPLNEVKLKALWKRIIHSEDYACPTFHAFSLGFRTAEAAHGIGENK